MVGWEPSTADHCITGGAGWHPVGLAQRMDVGLKAHPDLGEGSTCPLLSWTSSAPCPSEILCFFKKREGRSWVPHEQSMWRGETLQPTVAPFLIFFPSKLGLQAAQNRVCMDGGLGRLAWFSHPFQTCRKCGRLSCPFSP